MKLSEEELRGLAILWEQDCYSRPQVERRLKDLLQAPLEPSDMAKATLNTERVDLPGVENELAQDPPMWLKGVCIARSIFVVATLIFQYGMATEQAFLVLYGLQNPYKLMALRVSRKIEPAEPFLSPEEFNHMELVEEPAMKFTIVQPETPHFRRSPIGGAQLHFHRARAVEVQGCPRGHHAVHRGAL
eukprot:10984276-Lingulodinium_polyedra.AAC.1